MANVTINQLTEKTSPEMGDELALYDLANASTKKVNLESLQGLIGGVTSFNGREGGVTPQAGDYQASDITFEEGDVDTELTRVNTELTEIGTQLTRVDTELTEITNLCSTKISTNDFVNFSGTKNLIPFPFTEILSPYKGLTITNNNDGTITINGTSTEKMSLIFISSNEWKRDLPAGEYTLTGCPEGGSISGEEVETYCMVAELSDGQTNIPLIDTGQ